MVHYRYRFESASTILYRHKLFKKEEELITGAIKLDGNIKNWGEMQQLKNEYSYAYNRGLYCTVVIHIFFVKECWIRSLANLRINRKTSDKEISQKDGGGGEGGGKMSKTNGALFKKV